MIYVLLATVCDVMPLRKLNRLIALKALQNFDLSKNIALVLPKSLISSPEHDQIRSKKISIKKY